MGFSRTRVGVDLGSHSVKVVALAGGGRRPVSARSVCLDRESLLARGIEPRDRVAVLAALRQAMLERDMSPRGVLVALAGGEGMLRYASLPPVPFWRLQTMMRFEVEEVEGRLGQPLAWETSWLSPPVVASASRDRVALLGMTKEKTLQATLESFAAAGFSVEAAVPACLAFAAACCGFGRGAGGERELELFLDLGASCVHVALLLGGRLVFARTVALGGDHFTAAVAAELGLETRRAERFKRQRGTLEPPDAAGEERTVNAAHALRGVAAQLENAVAASLRACRTQTRLELPEPARLVLAGGASELTGLAQYLEAAFSAPVERYDPHLPDLAGEAGAGGECAGARPSPCPPRDLAVALGLAAVVRAQHDATPSIRLLPAAVRRRRRFRERTVFLYGAAVLLLLALVAAFVDARLRSRDAERYARELEAAAARLEAEKDRMEADLYAVEQARARIERIYKEVEVVAFQSFLLDYFRSAMPPEVRLSRVRLEDDAGEAGSDLGYRLVVSGSADNANGRGNALIRELSDRLEREDRVRRVEIEDSRPDGTLYRFTMAVMPRFRAAGFALAPRVPSAGGG